MRIDTSSGFRWRYEGQRGNVRYTEVDATSVAGSGAGADRCKGKLAPVGLRQSGLVRTRIRGKAI